MLQIYCDLLHEQPNILYAKSLCNSLLNYLISRVSGLFEELHVIMDKSIKQKSSSEAYPN